MKILCKLGFHLWRAVSSESCLYGYVLRCERCKAEKQSWTYF